MAILDDVMQQVTGSGKQKDLMGNLMGMLGGEGGMSGLLKGFQDNGLGDKANSWVGKGPNQAVSGDEVERAVGKRRIKEVAARSNLSEGEAKDGLAKMLPDFVNKLTPDGKLPAGLDDQIKGMAKGLLG